MDDVEAGFVPDLRDLRSWPDLQGTLWREPYLVEHTHVPLYRAVRSHIEPPIDLLDVGCGSGHMALELAREGCRVTAIDADENAIELARKAQQSDRLVATPEQLSYEIADVAHWRALPNSFDVVVASRVLHHVADLPRVLRNIAEWLRPGGKLVCVEFAYDRLDRRWASWLYQVKGLLEASGCSAHGHSLQAEPAAAIEEVWDAWWRYHEEEHELNTYDQLISALRGALRERHHDWLPYLYWEALEDLDLPADAGAAVARFLDNLEEHLITQQQLPAVLFSWVGERPSSAA